MPIHAEGYSLWIVYLNSPLVLGDCTYLLTLIIISYINAIKLHDKQNGVDENIKALLLP